MGVLKDIGSGTRSRLFAEQMKGQVPEQEAIVQDLNAPGFLERIGDFFSSAKMPTGDQVVGTNESRGQSPLGKMFSGKQGDIIGQSLLDLQKRQALQPVLETEALFRAFGKGGGLTDIAEKGALGSDPISDIREGKLLNEKTDMNRQFRRAILDKIRNRKSSHKNSAFDLERFGSDNDGLGKGVGFGIDLGAERKI